MKSITLSRPHRAVLATMILTMGLCAASARAQVLDVPLKWTYKGAVYLRAYASDNSCQSLYTVPAGLTLRVTDFLLANESTTVRALPYQYLCTGASSCTSVLTTYITAPAGNTLVDNLTTGYRVDAGQQLFVCNYSGSGDIAAWSFNGYTYTIP